MKNEPKPRFAEPPVSRSGDTPTSEPAGQSFVPGGVVARAGSAGLLLVSLLYGVAAAQGSSPTQLRRFIDQQVGGIQKLMVPAHDATFRSRGLPMEARTRGSRLPRRSAISGKCSSSTRSERPEFCRSSVASSPRGRPPPAEAVTWVRQREGRHAPQLRRGRRGAGLHGRLGELHSTPTAPARAPAPRQSPYSPVTQSWTNSPR